MVAITDYASDIRATSYYHIVFPVDNCNNSIDRRKWGLKDLTEHLPYITPSPGYHKATISHRRDSPDFRPHNNNNNNKMMATENLVDSISLACVKDKEWPEFSRYRPEKTSNSGNRSPPGQNGSGKVQRIKLSDLTFNVSFSSSIFIKLSEVRQI